MSQLNSSTNSLKLSGSHLSESHEVSKEGSLPESGKSLQVVKDDVQPQAQKTGRLQLPLMDEDLANIRDQNMKLVEAEPMKAKEKIDVSGLKNPDVRKAAGKVAERLGKIQSGVSQGQGQGLKLLGSMQAKQGLEHLFKVADDNNDPQMLTKLLDAISFEGKTSMFEMTSADGRARVRAAQVFTALQGDGTYTTLKQNIDNLPHDEKSLRSMARDPALLTGLDKTKYADVHKLLKAVDGSDYTVESHHLEWHLDQAVLMEAYRSLEGKDPATQKKLALIMLHSFGKAAPLGNTAGELEMQSTPFFGANQYYRSNAGNKLLHELRQDIATKAGIPAMQMHLLDNSRFSEILARAYPLKGVETSVSSLQQFENSLEGIFDSFAVTQMEGTAFPPLTMEVDHKPVPQPIVLDVTGMYQGKNLSTKDLHAQMTSDLEKVFLDKAEEYLTDWPNYDKTEFAKDLMRNVRIVAFAKEGDVDILVTPQFLLGGPVEGRHSDFQNELLTMTRDGANYTAFHESIKHTIIETGYRPDIIRAKEMWLGLKSPQEILAKQNIQITELATSSGPTPRVVENFDKFTEMTVFKKFADLEKPPTDEVLKEQLTLILGHAPSTKELNDYRAKSDRPYLRVLPGATVDLLHGLADYKPNEGGIDKVFADKGLTDLLQTSYFRMAIAMQSAIDGQGEMVSVLNAIETINQELAMILAIVEPHGQNAFGDGIRSAMTTGSDQKPPTIPVGLETPIVHLKPSSMHCLASIASSVEAQKGTNELNVCVLKDNYYEGVGALTNSNTYKVSVMDGDKLGDKQNPVPLDLKPFKDKAPLDLFVCDFHHNISIDRQHYKVEDLSRQVDELFANDLVAKKFTVALDCTIDFINSPDVRDFLEHNKARITSGELNVVMYRSAQKFDMFGLDNYYGGFSVTVNKGQDYGSFNTRMDAPDDQLGGLARQGLSHVGANAAPRMDQYRQAIMDNAKKLYDALPPECIYSPDSTCPIQVSKTDDPNSVFLDIKFPDNPKAFEEFDRKIKAFAKQNELPFTQRASFGFVTTNYSFIAGSKCRLNPGLEGPEVQQKYVDFFKAVTTCVNDAATAGAKLGLDGDDLKNHIAKALADMPLL